MNESNDKITISKKTMMPISFVITVVIVALFIAGIKNNTETNERRIGLIEEAEYVTSETLDLKIDPIASDVSDIKADIRSIIDKR